MPLPDADAGARAHLRAYLRSVLFSDPKHPPTFPVEIMIRDSNGYKHEVTFTRHDLLDEEQAATRPAASPAPDLAGLQRIHLKLLEKAVAAPVTTKKLIQLAGYEPNSYSRGAVTELVRRSLLTRTADGVSRSA